ncbi:MAG: ATP-binding protein [Lachnospiraceae bacterium]|nr:ATP-binding protein [Lachnospiraceae bacterium]
MGMWILSFCLIAIETWGSVYFFGIFMERKRAGWLDKCRYVVLYLACVAIAILGGYFDLMGIKVLLAVLTSMAFTAVFYRVNWKQFIFFPALNYSLLFLADLFSLQAENILIVKDEVYASKLAFLALPAKLVWVLMLFVLRRIWKDKNSYGKLSLKEWQKFGIVPLFTVASMLLMYFCYSGEKKVQAVYERQGRKAVINIKLVQEGGKLIFSVKNPVAEKVQVTDGIALDSNGGMHGVSLMNVRAVVDKYGGDFAISCDQEKFQAVVMI